LKALGLDDGHALGVVAPRLLHQFPVELFRTSLGQIGSRRVAIERGAPENAPLAEPARAVDDDQGVGTRKREIEGEPREAAVDDPCVARDLLRDA
jgi:hypothetical protein